MKFKFANGHSVNIWDSEYERIVISEGRITCTRPGGKIAIIEIPKQWMEGTWPKPETRREGKGWNGASEEICSQENMINPKPAPTGSYGRQKVKVENFENTKEHNLKFSKLANQIEALKSDLNRFTTKTNEQMKPLLALPKELDIFRKESAIATKSGLKKMGDDVVEFLGQRIDDLNERVDGLLTDVERLKKVGHISDRSKSDPCSIST